VPESEPDENLPFPESQTEDLSDVVRRAMMQTADLMDLEERLKEVSERISQFTPPPEPSP